MHDAPGRKAQETNVMGNPLNVAIIGMGGFARAHQRSIMDLEQEGLCRLICACDPNLAGFADDMAELNFKQRGVRVFEDYETMLAACHTSLDLVTIPTPVPLHAPMHHRCVTLGLPVYLEKPPTLDYREMQAMLAVEAQAVKQTQVGFNHIGEPPRRQVKQRLAKGEFGRLKTVGYRGLWPRTASYFQRAAWAGRLMLNERLVLDSGMGNAMAHHLHNLLFWAGWRDEQQWADVEWVEAELYRAHAVEGADTLFVRSGLTDAVTLQAVFSHACRNASPRFEWLDCENARITWSDLESPINIDWLDGRRETVPPEPVGLIHNLRMYLQYLNNERDRPLTRLIDARPFVELCGLAYVAAGNITSIAPTHKTCYDASKTGDQGLEIQGIETAADRFLEQHCWPSEQGLPWASAGGRAERSALSLLPETINIMLKDHPCV